MSAPIDPRRGHDEHGEWDALAVGWALSALDRADEELFAAHLPGCARCTAIVRESLYTVADLAYALPDEAPPASLKTRLMAAVTAEPRTAASSPSTPETAEEWPLGEPHPGTPGYNVDWLAQHQPPAKNEPIPAARPEPVVPPEVRLPAAAEPGPAGPEVRRDDLSGRRSAGSRSDDGVVVPLASRRRRLLISVAAAAVVALIAALAIWNVQLRSDQNNLRQIVAQRDAAIQQLTANEPARVAALTADGKPSETRKATLVVRGDQVEIITETLGATTSNETYWLWTLRCDTPEPTDLKPIQGFTVTQSEFSVRNIGSDPGAATATCFALSSEVGTATPKAPREVVAVGQPR
ncbi:MAG TPA: hypothetical protein VI357_25440 [Mycobacteriales bacterium]